MVQRIYLIPVRRELVDLFVALVTHLAEACDGLWQRLAVYSAPHRRASNISRRLLRGIDASSCARAGLAATYRLAAETRPYLITEPTLTATVALVDKLLLPSGDDDSVERVLREQLQALSTAYDANREEEVDDAEAWRAARERLKLVRALRAAARAGQGCRLPAKPAEAKPRRRDDVLPDDIGAPQFETLAPAEVPARFGRELLTLFGRVAGLCEPSWYLGRDYWLGSLAIEPLEQAQATRYTAFRDGLLCGAQPAGAILAKAGAPGYEKGVPRLCEHQTTGLYWPASAVPDLLSLLGKHRQAWTALGALLTGYTPEALQACERPVAEALSWVKRHDCGLLEVDDLVGQEGFR